MKQIVSQLCEVTLCGLMFFFCLQILFGKWGTWEMAQELVGQFKDADLVSENGVRLQEMISRPVPQVQMEEAVYHTGEKIMIFSRIQVRGDSEQPWRYLTEADGFSAELLDISDLSGRSLVKNVFMEKTPAAPDSDIVADFSKEKGELIFYRSGCYVLKIRVTSPYGSDTVKRAVVPVEMG